MIDLQTLRTELVVLAIALAARTSRAQPPVPQNDPVPDPPAVEPPAASHIGSGALGIIRIDLAGRCCAVGLGLALALDDRLELEIAGLRSSEWGVYLGARYRFLVGRLRPYASGGVPAFAFTSDMSTQFAPGLRIAGGAELAIDGHVSVELDLGLEHFFNVGGTAFDATVWVPTIGAIVRP
jgi:hypothetical protein